MGRKQVRPNVDTERERRRRQRANAHAVAELAFVTRREAATRCAWCGGEIDVKPVGRIPKWCSAVCRQRAWEQRRAAASGRASVEIVERVIQVPVERMRMPRRDEWPAVLGELASQLDSGRIYQRDLEQIGSTLASVLVAYRGRRTPRPLDRIQPLVRAEHAGERTDLA